MLINFDRYEYHSDTHLGTEEVDVDVDVDVDIDICTSIDMT
jgi:hypothetical protein